jgi:hypothetical protein
MNSGNLNFLEPFGLLQACNGTALPYRDNIIDKLVSLEVFEGPVVVYVRYYRSVFL